MTRIFCILLITLSAALSGIAQAPELSLSELKNSYLSKRNQFMDASTKVFSEAEQAEMDALLEKIRAKDATSFEYYLVSYINGNYNLDLQENLFKAYALNATDEVTQRELLGYYILTENLAKQKEFTQKVYKQYTAAELEYYRDAMPSENGAILVTSNQDDMYAFLAVQLADGTGTGVKVVCLDFLKNSAYKSALSAYAGTGNSSFLGNETAYLKTLITGSSKKVFISTTVPQNYLSAVADNMVLTGLTYQYGSVNQRSSLDNFWTKMKGKDLGKFAEWVASEQKLYSNYLPPLLTLYRLKLSEGAEDITLKSTIQSIADKTGRKAQVDEILYQYASDE